MQTKSFKKEAKNLLNGIVINKFSRNEWDFKNPSRSRNRIKTVKDNSEKFMDWILKILKSYSDKEVPDATAIYMNDNNNEYLRKYIDSFVWMSYSPTTDNSLKNNEYRVEVDKI